MCIVTWHCICTKLGQDCEKPSFLLRVSRVWLTRERAWKSPARHASWTEVIFAREKRGLLVFYSRLRVHMLYRTYTYVRNVRAWAVTLSVLDSGNEKKGSCTREEIPLSPSGFPLDTCMQLKATKKIVRLSQTTWLLWAVNYKERIGFISKIKCKIRCRVFYFEF